METLVEAYLRLLEAHRVDGGQWDAIGRVGQHDVLHDVLLVLDAVEVELRDAHALYLIEEEAVEVAVVAVDVESLLCLQLIEHCMHVEYGEQ